MNNIPGLQSDLGRSIFFLNCVVVVRTSKEQKWQDRATSTHKMESEIRGYHVYRGTWMPEISDLLCTAQEMESLHEVQV